MSDPTEFIPNEDSVYCRIARNTLSQVGLSPNCIVVNPNTRTVSVDWCKYCSPHETRARQGKDQASAYGVVEFAVGRIREIPQLQVEHDPDQCNRAHSEVRGFSPDRTKRTGQRKRMWELALIVGASSPWCVDIDAAVVVPIAGWDESSI